MFEYYNELVDVPLVSECSDLKEIIENRQQTIPTTKSKTIPGPMWSFP